MAVFGSWWCITDVSFDFFVYNRCSFYRLPLYMVCVFSTLPSYSSRDLMSDILYFNENLSGFFFYLIANDLIFSLNFSVCIKYWMHVIFCLQLKTLICKDIDYNCVSWVQAVQSYHRYIDFCFNSNLTWKAKVNLFINH